MRKTKQKQKHFRLMHSKQDKDLSPVEFYLLAKKTINTDMYDWVSSHDGKHIAEIHKLDRKQNNPLWTYQSVIAKNATHEHGNYLKDVTETDINELSNYWDTLTAEQQKQEVVSMWARLKWVNSAYREFGYLFGAIDSVYLNNQNRQGYLTHSEGVLNIIDVLSQSPHTWGAFSIVGHQDVGWHHPHSIGGGAIRDAQRHEGQTPPIRKSKITDTDLIAQIECFKENKGVRRGLNKSLSKTFSMSENAIGNRLKKFCDENPEHPTALFILDQ